MTNDELDSLLSEAKKNNHVNNVTGMLVYHDGCFIQILEGEKNEIKSLFNKISHDPRHKSIYLIDERDIDSRSFETWDMAFKILTKNDLVNFPSLKQMINNTEKNKLAKLTDIEEAFISISVN